MNVQKMAKRLDGLEQTMCVLQQNQMTANTKLDNIVQLLSSRATRGQFTGLAAASSEASL